MRILRHSLNGSDCSYKLLKEFRIGHSKIRQAESGWRDVDDQGIIPRELGADPEGAGKAGLYQPTRSSRE
jgi:hypothetical protein